MKLECYDGLFSYFTGCVPWGRACTSPMQLKHCLQFLSAWDDCIIPNRKQKQRLRNFFCVFNMGDVQCTW